MPSEAEAAFSLPVNVRRLPKKGQMLLFEASKEQREQIARDYNLISIESFNAEGLVAPWKRDGVKLTGHVKAQVTQPCAVSGEPLSAVVDEAVEVLFLPEGSRLARPATDADGEIVFDPMGDDLPEPFVGDSIDLAQSWLEFFDLGLDPHARLEGAEFDRSGLNLSQDSPFSVLADMKPSLKNA